MTNGRLTAKDRNLVKGAIRRVFSRSELRRSVLDAARIDYLDPDRPRVKKWGVCKACKQKTPLYLMQADHVNPIIPVDKTLEEMSWDEVVNNIWCDPKCLDILCKPCHNTKTKAENKQRRMFQKERKNNVK